MNLPLYQPDPAKSTRFLFFTGKGGVGKTSLFCATALKLVETGKRVLLVSTDPEEVLETKIFNAPTPIAGGPGLHAINIDPVAAAAAYRERLIGPMRGPASGRGSAEHGRAALGFMDGGDRGVRRVLGSDRKS